MAKKHFKAESKRLLDLMVNSIYTNREIFLREIISNASDAIDKLHYISLTDEEARKQRTEGEIIITRDEEARTLTVSDNGIGMTAEELENNLGTICRSGSLSFKEEMSEDEEKEAVNIIGQFGVGFYSAFMVSDKVTVISKSYKDGTAHKWESDGADGYTVTECEKENIGTEIILHLKDDTENEKYSDYLKEYRIRSLVKQYSDYIRFPIKTECEKSREVGEGDDKKHETYFETETLNSMKPIWQKQKKDIKKEESDNFYKETFFDYEEPLFTLSVATEGVVSYKALLFVPAKTPYDYFTKEYKRGLKLYSSGVLITDCCEELLSENFRFVKGVVDTEDLSLNISREMLQKDAALKTIAQSIEKKIKAELKRALEKDREKYEKFYASFGIQLKYGTVQNYGMEKENLRELLLFHSANENKLVTLDEYLEKMPSEQKFIYYACADTVQKAGNLPQAELVKAKGYDMLCLTDEVDEFVMQILGAHKEKEFCSINSEKAELTDDSAKEEAKKLDTENREMLDFVKDTLGIADVVISSKLKSHPVCLSAKGGITLEMEKYFAKAPGDSEKIKAERVLELSAFHPAFTALKNAYETDREKAKVISKVLYGEALLIAGLQIDDPSEFADLIGKLF